MQLAEKHMDHVTAEQLDELMQPQAGPCITILMPAYQAGADIQQNPVRLRNLLRIAHDQLAEQGIGSANADALLQPATDLIGNSDFWQRQSQGLALFVNPKGIQSFRVPLALDEVVRVNDRYYVKPLLCLLSDDGMFYVLALSQNKIRLLRATRDTFQHVPLPDTPDSMAEALEHFDFEKSLQFHTSTSTPDGGRRDAMYHGHGSGAESLDKEKVLRFLHVVDDGVSNALAGERAPLVLAGVEYVRSMFAGLSRYQVILDEGVDGSMDRVNDQDLHDRAWELVEPRFLYKRAQATEAYRLHAGRQDGLAVSTVADVVRAAAQARVDTLFVPDGEEQWGVFHQDTDMLEVHPERTGGSEDLLDLAALHTWRNGGVVYVVPSNEMPDDVPAAAILRF